MSLSFLVVVSRSDMVSQNVYWLAERNLLVRDHQGKFDALKRLTMGLVNAFRVDRTWYGRFVTIQLQWIAAQQQGVAHAAALSRAISRSNDHFDKGHASVVERPPAGRRLRQPGILPMTASGEYILSNDAGFNPNLHSNTTGRPLSPSDRKDKSNG